MSNVNDWFFSLPERRRQILAGDKWALADAAFEAGKEAARTQPAPAITSESGNQADQGAPAITSESGNQADQGASAITSESAQAVALLTDDELQVIEDNHLEGGSMWDVYRAIEQAVRSKLGAGVPMPPEDWSVFNTGAEVATGLTWAEAWDYMTPSRIERGWTAVCVANKSNIGIVGKEGA